MYYKTIMKGYFSIGKMSVVTNIFITVSCNSKGKTNCVTTLFTLLSEILRTTVNSNDAKYVCYRIMKDSLIYYFVFFIKS